MKLFLNWNWIENESKNELKLTIAPQSELREEGQ